MPDQAELLQKIKALEQVAFTTSSKGFLNFLNQIKIDCRPSPALFRDKADPWQWALAQTMAPAIEQMAGLREDYTGPRNFWLTMPRGHDKSGLLGRLLNWALTFSRHRIGCTAAAADKEQASFILNSMKAEADLNPWFGKTLYAKNWQMKGRTGTLDILAADAKSSFGGKADFSVYDELTHWPKRDLWDALYSGAHKRGKNAVNVVITNAGLQKTWQWDLLQIFRKAPSWFVYEAPGPIASWMTGDQADEIRAGLTPQMARRVLGNEWLDPAEGCDFVTRAEAQACEDLGAQMGLRRQAKGTMGLNYIAVIDYGISHDRTVMTVMHMEGDMVLVDQMVVLQGSRAQHVSIAQVEEWIDQVINLFGIQLLVVDKFQMEATCQRFASKVMIEQFNYQGGSRCHEMLMALRNAIVNRQLVWYPGCGDTRFKGRIHTLVDEFAEAVVKQMSYGMRIDHLPGLHDDRIQTLGMGLLALYKLMPKKNLPDSSLWF